jgi:hypothetical protein
MMKKRTRSQIFQVASSPEEKRTKLALGEIFHKERKRSELNCHREKMTGLPWGEGDYVP